MTPSSLYAGTTIDTKLTGFDSLLVDEPFIFEALGSFIAVAHQPDCPSDRSAARSPTQIPLEMFLCTIRLS
jgi:hypothetical protein